MNYYKDDLFLKCFIIHYWMTLKWLFEYIKCIVGLFWRKTNFINWRINIFSFFRPPAKFGPKFRTVITWPSKRPFKLPKMRLSLGNPIQWIIFTLVKCQCNVLLIIIAACMGIFQLALIHFHCKLLCLNQDSLETLFDGF